LTVVSNLSRLLVLLLLTAVVLMFVVELKVLLLGVTLELLAELMFVFEEADKLDEETELWTAGVVDALIAVVPVGVGIKATGIVVFSKPDDEFDANWLCSSPVVVDIFCKLRGIWRNNSISLDS